MVFFFFWEGGKRSFLVGSKSQAAQLVCLFVRGKLTQFAFSYSRFRQCQLQQGQNGPFTFKMNGLILLHTGGLHHGFKLSSTNL